MTPDEIAALSREELDAEWFRVVAQEARAIIDNQASTLPKPNEQGLIDIGSMNAAWVRADGVLTATGRRIHSMSDGPFFMSDPPPARR